MNKALWSAAVTVAACLLAFQTSAGPVRPVLPSPPAQDMIRLVGQGDYYCETQMFGKKTRLWLEGNAPVRYKWSSNTARKAELRGDVIMIQASPMARISNVVMGKASDGRKTITGDFKFKNNRQNGLVFTCTPE